MQDSDAVGGQYKVKLESGRILGPLDLWRVKKLVASGHISGREFAREYPSGDWTDINRIPAIAEILIQKAAGTLVVPAEGADGVVVKGAAYEQTKVLPGGEPTKLEGAQVELPLTDDAEEREEKTMVADTRELPSLPSVTSEDATMVADSRLPVAPVDIHYEKTVVFQQPQHKDGAPSAPGGFSGGIKARRSGKEALKAVVAAVLLGVAGYTVFFGDADEKPEIWKPVRPRLPAAIEGKADPARSEKIYIEAMKQMVDDNVTAYRKTVVLLHQSAALDISNVKALAMLAAAYINLIDSSNKDENYFSVISKLIEMSRARAVDLPETIIADVEFFIMAGRAEAAQNRIVEYTKVHQTFGLEMFFYLSYAFFSRGDFQTAARFISQIPENKIFTPRIFHLKGQIAEKLNDKEVALAEYRKAVKFKKTHARSHLRIADILDSRGELRSAAKHLEFLMLKPFFLSPRELSRAYYLHSRLNQLFQKWDGALADMEKAVKLDRGNHDYLLELYTLRARAGANVQAMQGKARMYFYLGEGEKLIKEGKHHEALTVFLQARQADMSAALPLVRIGDMFYHVGDLENAKLNYRGAAEKAPQDINIWSKYIKVLIQTYEWEEAQKAMDKFRALPVSQSAIDKAAGDLYQKQGRHTEAMVFYKKAMARETIDPDVYVAYAKSLMAVKNFKDAPFFFSLAQRFDPLNAEATVSIAKCISNTESIERAINMLQDELQKGAASRAELLAAIAEFEIQRGGWQSAQMYIKQAMEANPDFAYPWKLQAQVYMSSEGSDRKALQRALDAYKSYSDRNPSDPSGYLERYRIYTKKSEFDKASEELNRIYSYHPKFPNLHYYKGALYAVQGNHKAAAEEYKVELANNPGSISTMLALGKEYIEIRAIRDALSLFNKAMQLAPAACEPKLQSGYTNYLLKNYQGAVALYQAAAACDRGNPLVYKRMGLAYRDMGDAQNARLAFRKYIEMEPDAPDRRGF